MRRRALVVVATAALLLVPTTALAHPSFNPNEIPSGDPVEATLVIPHGCAPGGGMPSDDASVETVRFDLQKAEGVTVTPMEVEGWTTSEDDEAWTWEDDGGATTAPIELPVLLTLDGTAAAGDELHLKAFQECRDGSAFQWIGTPDEEAEYPAVLVVVSEGEVDTVETDDDHDMGDMDRADDEMDMEDQADAEDMDEDMDEGMAMDEVAEEDDGLPVLSIVLGALIGAALAAVVSLVRRRRA